MVMQIKVPSLGESVSEATVAKWLKQVGDSVEMDEVVVELETDKVTLEVRASAAGALGEILAREGETVGAESVLGIVGEAGAATATPSARPATPPAAAPVPSSAPSLAETLAPSVQKLVTEHRLDPSAIAGTGKDGRLTKGDVLSHLASPPSADRREEPAGADRREERVRMTRLRKRIAERLKQAQNTAAMLTTFNEVDMTAAMQARAQFNEDFEKKHGVKLGFMSLFVKACINALKDIPAVNAEIDGEEIVYKSYYDIGVAVGTEQGLVVPVVRNADAMGFADIEKKISELGKRAREGKLSLDELSGGSFTISNGGIYGSLLSTPILNPPQSGILGMHKIQRRPVAVLDKSGERIEIRPMMYVALSYDHRIIDGREAVTFLIKVKEAIETPQRLLFDL